MRGKEEEECQKGKVMLAVQKGINEIGRKVTKSLPEKESKTSFETSEMAKWRHSLGTEA